MPTRLSMRRLVIAPALIGLLCLVGRSDGQPVVPVQGAQGGMPVSVQGTIQNRQATTGAVVADLAVTITA